MSKIKYKKSQKVPAELQETFDAIAQQIKDFCSTHLNEEYEALALELTAKLARKRPSPLKAGRPNTWACGVINALGRVNFLTDRSEKPYVSSRVLCEAFGINQDTSRAKGKLICDIFKLGPFTPEWTLPSKMDKNPMAWTIIVNGLIVDARYAPRSLQEYAYEHGFIPYVPEEV